MAQVDTILNIPARPEPLTIDITTTAVLVIDMQNDFGSDGGMFQRAGIDISPIRSAVMPTARVVAAARRAGMPVIYIKMEHRPDLADAGADSSPHRRKHDRLKIGSRVSGPNGEDSRILVRDTWNTDILARLKPKPGDIIVSKHRYSGFYETELDMILRTRGIRSLIVTGCTTSVCVDATIRDAMYRDYPCVLLTDCTGEPIGYGTARSNHEASLLTIELLLGWTATSDALLAALGEKKPKKKKAPKRR